MAQLYFIYGTMNTGKSMNLLSVVHNYKERGMSTLVLKPDTDDRDSSNEVVSRTGLKTPCDIITDGMDIVEFFKYKSAQKDIHCVLVDEAQFLSPEHVQDLCKIVDEYNTPVMCYGLKTDFKADLFVGSKELLIWADKLIETKTVCHCGKKTTMVAKMDKEGNPIISGDQIDVGGNEKYVSLCRKHYKEFVSINNSN